MAEGDWSDAAPTWKSKDTFLEEVGRISVYAALASIAVVAADAVVSTDNQLGMMTSRTARALKRRGGDDIEIESMTKRRGIGEAWNTNAGRLNVNHVIHVALLDDRAATSAETIGKSVTNSLLVADELKLESLVFPALGTGRGGFPIADSARIARARLHEHVEKSPTGSIRAVGFALYSPEDHRDFRAGYLPEAR